MTDTGRLLNDRSFEFALRIVRIAQSLAGEKCEYVLSKQVLRSGTSIGANIRESVFAQSTADFVSKWQRHLAAAVCAATLAGCDVVDYDVARAKATEELAPMFRTCNVYKSGTHDLDMGTLVCCFVGTARLEDVSHEYQSDRWNVLSIPDDGIKAEKGASRVRVRALKDSELEVYVYKAR